MNRKWDAHAGAPRCDAPAHAKMQAGIRRGLSRTIFWTPVASFPHLSPHRTAPTSRK